MARLPESIAHLVERLAPLGRITARPMFGAFGLYCDGVFFAIAAGEQVYLKADDANRGDFEALGLAPFQPSADKPTTMSYYPLPEAAIDDDEALLHWARSGFEAGLRGRRGKRRKSRA